MNKRLIATVLGAGFVVLAAVTPVRAEDAPIPPIPREELRALLDSMELLMKSFGQFVKDLPTYDAPEILPNGDILIRRKKAEDEPHNPLDTRDRPGPST
ncbi:MAG: hypothetical protein HQL36_06365 [Alphaproteobacteria bacterium]|nr:hypothetical protein [Alphaproteobacteria bacterium]MBF0249637.1 hypothetical protein [Alphaproteobacteria bacterium]